MPYNCVNIIININKICQNYFTANAVGSERINKSGTFIIITSFYSNFTIFAKINAKIIKQTKGSDLFIP